MVVKVVCTHAQNRTTCVQYYEGLPHARVLSPVVGVSAVVLCTVTVEPAG